MAVNISSLQYFSTNARLSSKLAQSIIPGEAAVYLGLLQLTHYACRDVMSHMSGRWSCDLTCYSVIQN